MEATFHKDKAITFDKKVTKQIIPRTFLIGFFQASFWTVAEIVKPSRVSIDTALVADKTSFGPSAVAPMLLNSVLGSLLLLLEPFVFVNDNSNAANTEAKGSGSKSNDPRSNAK